MRPARLASERTQRCVSDERSRSTPAWAARGGRSVDPPGEAADRAAGDTALGVQLEDRGAAVGPAVEAGRHRAAPLAPNRGGSSDDGRLVGTREHWFLCSFLPRHRRNEPGLRCWCSSRFGRSSDGPCLDAGASRSVPYSVRSMLRPAVRCSVLFLTRSSMGARPRWCQLSRPRARSQGTRSAPRSGADGHAASTDSGVITVPQAALGCRNALLLHHSAPKPESVRDA
jgi:hypothetical protein